MMTGCEYCGRGSNETAIVSDAVCVYAMVCRIQTSKDEVQSMSSLIKQKNLKIDEC